jgi:solute carrier family 35, member E3
MCACVVCVGLRACQVTKLAVIPCTVLLQWALYRTGTSTPIKLALSILTLGVGMATVSSLDVNMDGLIVALIGVLTTSFQQIVRGPHGHAAIEQGVRE